MSSPRRLRSVVAAEFQSKQLEFPTKEGLDVKCLDRSFEYQDYPRQMPPSEMEARSLCSGCPFPRALCREYGMVMRADGIWGGVRLVDGKVQHDKKEGEE